MFRGITTIATAMLLWAGCASAPPPEQLVEARRAYDRAKGGPAHDVAPVQLDNARLALLRAEKAFEAEPESPATRDLAYIAERKAQIAMAHGRIALAERQQADARSKQERLQAQKQELTESELSMTKEELAARRQQLSQSEKELQQERQAREKAEEAAAAALESLREIAQVKEESRGVVITLSGSVLFPTGQASLLPVAKQSLDQVAEMLQEYEDRQVIVEGHTDSRGSAAKNQALSEARANAVLSYLVQRGVSADRIRAVGVGEARPVADNSTAEGRANNRRVEIIVEKEKKSAKATTKAK